ncbi:MAG: helix-turn-helix domain-containing protein [Deltaproteobacteria bacterium]|nr:helix-turn-helix domain-containing protein [Deltaproteobacteria bacterium]
MAGMVGATRESVNKALRTFREKKLISLSGNTLQIHDVDALRKKIR